MTQEVPNQVPPAPMVSVVTVTYQHAPYIERCVDGVMAQRTSFRIEHLIGEDESTDGTRDICLKLAAEHPDRIRLFLRSRKDVTYLMGRPTGRANVLALYEAARGKYIAVCPGDDRWVDAEKLQAQVDLMEKSPDLAACFTNCWNQQGSEQRDYLRGWLNGGLPPAIVREADLVDRNFVPAVTFLFRRDLLYPLPQAIFEAPVSDWILVMHLASKGPIAFLDRMSAVREVHGGGIISSQGALHKIDVNLSLLHHIDAMTGGHHSDAIAQRTVELLKQGLQHAVDTGENGRAQEYWATLRSHRAYAGSLRERARWYMLTHARGLAGLVHRIRS